MVLNTLSIEIDPNTQGFRCGNCGSHIALLVDDTGQWRVTCRRCGARYVSDPCDKCGQSLSNHNERKCEITYLEAQGQARCLVCDKVKALSEFPRTNGTKRSRCNTCQSEYYKDWYEKNKSRRNWKKGTYTEDGDLRRKE